MIKLKDVLTTREKEMIQHYQYSILNTDIEDTENINLFQNEISRILDTAKSRYYNDNPGVVPIKKEAESKSNNGILMTRDLLTKEELGEIEFLKWRMVKSWTSWGKKRCEEKIESILDDAKRRNGY